MSTDSRDSAPGDAGAPDLLRHITLRQLQIFRVAARTDSHVEAAKRLHLTQPAVSMQMNQLSASFDAELFERRGRNMVLTRYGRALLPFVEEVAASLVQARRTLRAVREIKHQVIRVAAESAAQYFLHVLTEQCRAEFPELDFQVAYANRAGAVALVHGGACDLAVVAAAPEPPFAGIAMGWHCHGFVATPTHAAARQRHPDLRFVLGQPVMAREQGSGSRSALDQILHTHCSPVATLRELTSTEAIKQAVKAGAGVAMIPLLSVSSECRSRDLVVLRAPVPVVRERFYVWHRPDPSGNPTLDPALQFFASATGAILRRLVPDCSQEA